MIFFLNTLEKIPLIRYLLLYKELVCVRCTSHAVLLTSWYGVAHDLGFRVPHVRKTARKRCSKRNKGRADGSLTIQFQTSAFKKVVEITPQAV